MLNACSSVAELVEWLLGRKGERLGCSRLFVQALESLRVANIVQPCSLGNTVFCNALDPA